MGEAIQEARANASGLDDFMAQSNGTVFYSATVLPPSRFSAAPTVGPVSHQVTSSETRGWLLTWQEQGTRDGWQVKVQQDKEYVAGQQTQNQTYVASEGSHQVPSNETGVLLEPNQVAIDAFAQRTPAELGSFARFSVEPTRTSNPARWTYTLGYISEEAEDQSGVNIQRVQSITADGLTGYIEKIRGSSSFMAEFEDHGWVQPSSG